MPNGWSEGCLAFTACKWPFHARDFTMATGSLQLDMEPSARTFAKGKRSSMSQASPCGAVIGSYEALVLAVHPS